MTGVIRFITNKIMEKYRVYTDNGYKETTSIDVAKMWNGNTFDGIDIIEYVLPDAKEPISKKELYRELCDPITAEITRRKLIGDLSETEEAELIERLRIESEKIEQMV